MTHNTYGSYTIRVGVTVSEQYTFVADSRTEAVRKATETFDTYLSDRIVSDCIDSSYEAETLDFQPYRLEEGEPPDDYYDRVRQRDLDSETRS